MKQINHKLIVITRRDITPGYQAVQAGHAAIQFQHEHPEIARSWYQQSNYLIFLSVSDEASLYSFIEQAKLRDIKVSVFREPDINNEITAITLEPSEESRKLTSNLPLALKERKIEY